jgi:hypothetical protein
VLAQPQASQRAIADLVGVGEATIARDLGKNRYASFDAKLPSTTLESASFDAPPALPPDDYDVVKDLAGSQEIQAA